LLPFVDAEVVEALDYHLQQNRMTLRFMGAVSGIELVQNGVGTRIRNHLASGKEIVVEKALYRATEEVNLEAAELKADECARLKVNENYQIAVHHVYAAGDVIGFPILASTSLEQGRMPACRAFGIEAKSTTELFPYGIYTIPEISYIGKNEEELTQANIPYEMGKASYREIACGQIIGASIGMPKILFHRDTRELLGVHIIGGSASELIHIGQAVMSLAHLSQLRTILSEI
jgi:NAD(P) transhydrogenase